MKKNELNRIYDSMQLSEDKLRSMESRLQEYCEKGGEKEEFNDELLHSDMVINPQEISRRGGWKLAAAIGGVAAAAAVVLCVVLFGGRDELPVTPNDSNNPETAESIDASTDESTESTVQSGDDEFDVSTGFKEGMSTDIFTEAFYGSWIRQQHVDDFNEEMVLIDDTDEKPRRIITFSSGIMNVDGMWEDEYAYYMQQSCDSLSEILVVPKSEMDKMYVYNILNCRKPCETYRKSIGWKGGGVRPGKLNDMGAHALKEELGSSFAAEYDKYLTPNQYTGSYYLTDSSGKLWGNSTSGAIGEFLPVLMDYKETVKIGWKYISKDSEGQHIRGDGSFEFKDFMLTFECNEAGEWSCDINAAQEVDLSEWEAPFAIVDLDRSLVYADEMDYAYSYDGELSVTELTADNWYLVGSNRYAWAAEPTGFSVNSIDHPDEIDTVQYTTPYTPKKVYVGDEICGMRVTYANTDYYSMYEIGDTFFNGCRIELEGSAVMDGWAYMVTEDDYLESRGDVFFVPDAESCVLPVVRYDNYYYNLEWQRGDFRFKMEYPFPFRIGNVIEGADRFINADAVPMDGSPVRVRVTAEKVIMESYYDARKSGGTSVLVTECDVEVFGEGMSVSELTPAKNPLTYSTEKQLDVDKIWSQLGKTVGETYFNNQAAYLGIDAADWLFAYNVTDGEKSRFVLALVKNGEVTEVLLEGTAEISGLYVDDDFAFVRVYNAETEKVQILLLDEETMELSEIYTGDKYCFISGSSSCGVLFSANGKYRVWDKRSKEVIDTPFDYDPMLEKCYIVDSKVIVTDRKTEDGLYMVYDIDKRQMEYVEKLPDEIFVEKSASGEYTAEYLPHGYDFERVRFTDSSGNSETYNLIGLDESKVAVDGQMGAQYSSGIGFWGELFAVKFSRSGDVLLINPKNGEAQLLKLGSDQFAYYSVQRGVLVRSDYPSQYSVVKIG